MSSLLPIATAIALFACACGDGSSDSDVAAATDTGDVSAPACGRPLCIATSADGFGTGPLLVTSGANVCVYVTGLAPHPPARVIADGRDLGLPVPGEVMCLNMTQLPPKLPSGELWIAQGTDADGDGETDPGSEVESNRLSLITPAWIESIAPESAASGEEVTVTIGNAPPQGTHWEVIPGAGCSLQQLGKTGLVATVTALYDTDGSRCPLGVQVGLVPPGAPRPFVDPAAPGFTVLPVLALGCHTLPGEGCTLAGTGFGTKYQANTFAGTITLDGEAITPAGEKSWAGNAIHFTMPELRAGPKALVITREDGLTVHGEVTVFGWQRLGGLDRDSRIAMDHEGVMTDVEVAFLGAGNAFVTRRVMVSFRVDGAGGRLEPFPDPELPSGRYAGGELTHIRDYDRCARPRLTMIPPNLDRVAGRPVGIIAGRRRGAEAEIEWDGLAARPCEPTGDVLIAAEDLPGSWAAFRTEWVVDPETPPRMVDAGFARFTFPTDPPMPDPEGRPGRWVPILATRDDRAATTTLHIVYGPEPEPLLPAPLAGRGTLHEAGERIYLAGGEAGFDGILHEVRWREAREVPPPPLVPPDGMRAFSGDDRGRLWVIAIDETDRATLQRWDPAEGDWTALAAVPDTIVSGVNDLAVLDEYAVTVGYRGEGDTIDVVAHALIEGEWRQLWEPLARFRKIDHVCLGRASTDQAPDPDCGAGKARFGANVWSPLPGVPGEARLWATDRDLFVRYRVAGADDRYAYVAKLVGGLP